MLSEVDFDHRHQHAQALAHLRKESLDIYNRIHSIAEDLKFVEQVHRSYPHLPILPNLRCGAWYVDPDVALKDAAAYFKSTDGHTNNWSFNLRRPNLHLLPIAIQHDGFKIVDSTRAGKRMSDALSKTVPIWCAVINRAVKQVYHKDLDWSTELYCPPGVVSAQEHSHIETQLDGWVTSLLNSSYKLPDLVYPLRPFWITPSTSILPKILTPSEGGFYPILCISASKQINEGVERRAVGFAYVQGSGDDHELWGLGLTPQIFWNCKHQILSTDRSVLPDLIADLVARNTSAMREEWSTLPTSISKINGLILISAISDVPSSLPSYLPRTNERVAYVIIAEASDPSITSTSLEKAGDPSTKRKDILVLEMPEGKKGQMHFLQNVLPRSLPYIGVHLDEGTRVCVCCAGGRDTSVGVALAALQTYFDEDGNFVGAKDKQDQLINSANKKSISTRLQWIISSRPQANPSRVTLKRVNEFLLTPSSLRRHADMKSSEREPT